MAESKSWEDLKGGGAQSAVTPQSTLSWYNEEPGAPASPADAASPISKPGWGDLALAKLADPQVAADGGMDFGAPSQAAPDAQGGSALDFAGDQGAFAAPAQETAQGAAGAPEAPADPLAASGRKLAGISQDMTGRPGVAETAALSEIPGQAAASTIRSTPESAVADLDAETQRAGVQGDVLRHAELQAKHDAEKTTGVLAEIGAQKAAALLPFKQRQAQSEVDYNKTVAQEIEKSKAEVAQKFTEWQTARAELDKPEQRDAYLFHTDEKTGKQVEGVPSTSWRIAIALGGLGAALGGRDTNQALQQWTALAAEHARKQKFDFERGLHKEQAAYNSYARARQMGLDDQQALQLAHSASMAAIAGEAELTTLKYMPVEQRAQAMDAVAQARLAGIQNEQKSFSAFEQQKLSNLKNNAEIQAANDKRLEDRAQLRLQEKFQKMGLVGPAVYGYAPNPTLTGAAGEAAVKDLGDSHEATVSLTVMAHDAAALVRQYKGKLDTPEFYRDLDRLRSRMNSEYKNKVVKAGANLSPAENAMTLGFLEGNINAAAIRPGTLVEELNKAAKKQQELQVAKARSMGMPPLYDTKKIWEQDPGLYMQNHFDMGVYKNFTNENTMKQGFVPYGTKAK